VKTPKQPETEQFKASVARIRAKLASEGVQVSATLTGRQVIDVAYMRLMASAAVNRTVTLPAAPADTTRQSWRRAFAEIEGRTADLITIEPTRGAKPWSEIMLQLGHPPAKPGSAAR
jgi:hypothetical protein